MQTRAERQESHWRRSVHKALIELCAVMNSTQPTEVGQMTYQELVVHARGLLEKEACHLTGVAAEPSTLELE